jgi:2-polyprenyl-6-hydroxyphenyl methylase/3-demethylubiquinone-9 3-methyltransferase
LLPARYDEPWTAPFRTEIERRLVPGATILDIGGGRHPAIAAQERPDGTTYIGLDPDPHELDAAPPGSYDRKIVGGAEQLVPDLIGTVDLVVSWQVFEHVRSLEAVLVNCREYLAPTGAVVSLFSGRWAAFAVVNRMLPNRWGFPIVDRLARRSARGKPIFPAYYDSCSDRAIRRLTARWSSVDLTPFYRGAVYFSFARSALRMYLVYEDAAHRKQSRQLATHYLLVANP